MDNVIQFKEPEETPAYCAERLSVDMEMLAGRIAIQTELTPEIYEKQHELLLQASYLICKALDAIGLHKHKKAMVRFEVRE